MQALHAKLGHILYCSLLFYLIIRNSRLFIHVCLLGSALASADLGGARFLWLKFGYRRLNGVFDTAQLNAALPEVPILLRHLAVRLLRDLCYIIFKLRQVRRNARSLILLLVSSQLLECDPLLPLLGDELLEPLTSL